MQSPLAVHVIDTSALGSRRVTEIDYGETKLPNLAAELLDAGSPINSASKKRADPRTRLIRAGLDTAEKVSAHLQEAFEIAKSLRHGPMVLGADAVRWIAGVSINDPGRSVWHAKRLDGVSASSAWTYVAEYEGNRSWWNTARELDQIRMMIRLPQEETWNTFRGTQMEPVARSLFYRLHKDRFSPDEEGMDRIRQQRGIPGHPWLIGNLDELSKYSLNDVSGSVVVDFKCPSEPKDPTVAAQMEYVVQLHNYGMIAAGAGIPIRAIMLCHLYVAEDLAKLWTHMLEDDPEKVEMIAEQAEFALRNDLDCVRLTLKQVPIDPALQTRILTACSYADSRVQRGQLAPYPRKRLVGVDDGMLERAKSVEDNLAVSLLMAQGFVKRAEGYKGELQQIYQHVDTKRFSTGLKSISLSRTLYLNAGLAIEALKTMGADISGLQSTETKVETVNDNTAIEKALVNAGLDPDEYRNPQFKIGLSRMTKGEGHARIETLKKQTERGITNVLGEIKPDEPLPEEGHTMEAAT